VIIETIFSWPGVGRLMIQAVAGRDYPVVQATTFVVALLVVVINVGVDLGYRVLDPRVRLD
jgi:peptide/nickel transport system permease protein